MLRIGLDYKLTKVLGNTSDAIPAFAAPDQAALDNPLFTLLRAVRDAGSISGAAVRVGYSYRHVWGELKRWEAALEQPLVRWGKGKNARLTDFAERLVWAEEQARARLLPQILSLEAELERAFADAFNPQSQLLTMVASHDLALPLLRDRLAAQRLLLDIRYAPSVAALKALTSGAAQLAGFHVGDDHPANSITARTFKGLLKPGLHKLIGFAARRQGLMVRQGNPLTLTSLTDVARSHARFVNRPPGSGTRIEFEHLLAVQGISPDAISGFGREEATHLAVAAAIAADAADVGFGIEAAAQRYALDFVPLATERYYLVCLKETLELPAVSALRAHLASEMWHGAMAHLPGYVPDQPGSVLSLTRVLPWYRYPARRD